MRMPRPHGMIRGMIGVAVAVIGLNVGEANASATLPMHHCVSDPSGRIDFQGHLGSAGGPSTVRIFRTSDASDYYLFGLQAELETGAPTPAPVTTVEDAQRLLSVVRKIPAMLANASVAQIVDGSFTCLGFAPGRYSFLAEVHGNGASPNDPPLGISYYRADLDVSSVTRRAVVVVQGFHRIGTNPPE
jgi:hypothetical protein